MKFSWKIFFITFLIIITSFGAGGFLLINTVFTNTLNNRIDSAKKNNNYITTALSVYADNNLPTYGNLEYLRVSAIGFAKQIAGNSDSKIKIGSKSVKVKVTEVKEVVRKEDAATMYEAAV